MEGTVFKGVERVANHRLARFTGDYDLFGNQIYSQGQVLFDTVRRFKGQQAAAAHPHRRRPPPATACPRSSRSSSAA